MKKTLMLLCVAAAAAAYAETTPLTLTSTFEGRSLVTQIDNESITSSINSASTLLTNSTGAVSSNESYYIPNVNVGNGGSWTATLSYTLPSDISSFTLSTIDITGVGCNSSGANQTANNDQKTRGVNFAVTVISSDGTRTEVGTSTWTGILNNLSDDHTFTASTITLADALELTGNFSLEITATRTATDGCYFGLETLSLAGTTPENVPEPTTATLSLLALAGLAARRRRK